MLRDVAYRMVNPEWLNPEMKVKKTIPGGANDPWALYLECLTKAKQFHDQLKDRFHCQSYQFYGTDLTSPDRVVFTRKRYLHPTTHHFAREHFVNKGGFHAFVDRGDFPLSDVDEAAAIVSLELPAGRGDGTVPDSSGKILNVGSDRTIEIGAKDGSWFSIGHQDIYGTERAQNVVFTCIWNLIQTYIDDEVGREMGDK